MIDGASLAQLVAAENGRDRTLSITGVLTYGFGAPAVHAAHGHAGKALGSLGLRLGLPIGFAMIGGTIAGGCSASSEGCNSLTAAAVGLFLGMGAAIALDSAVLAREDVPREPRKIETGLRLAPSVTLGRDRLGAGVAGSF